MVTALDFLETKPCNICSGHRTRIVHAFPNDFYDHDAYETASWDGRQSISLTVVQCTGCGLVYTNPAFKESALDLIYPADIINVPAPEKLLSNTRKFDALLGTARPHMVGRTVVDVGSRYGVFPLVAKRAGFDAMGIEYNGASVAVGQAIGAPVHQGTIASLKALLQARGMTDVDNLFMVDVLEHLTDPRRDLDTIASLQRPGARLFLQQMDLDSLGYRLFRGNWHYLQPGAHMYYFTEKSLGLLLEKTGYRVLSVTRMPLIENLKSMFRKKVKSSRRRIFGPQKKERKINGKPLYLVRRQRSTDDMFLVVAERKA